MVSCILFDVVCILFAPGSRLYSSVGSRLYSTVYAVNGAGLKSAGISSDGVVIDSTPPLPLHKFRLGQNLLQNPSFEEDTPSGVTGAVHKGWTVDGTCYWAVRGTTGGMNPQDGQVYVDPRQRSHRAGSDVREDKEVSGYFLCPFP